MVDLAFSTLRLRENRRSLLIPTSDLVSLDHIYYLLAANRTLLTRPEQRLPTIKTDSNVTAPAERGKDRIGSDPCYLKPL
jgi:hypothetical protein